MGGFFCLFFKWEDALVSVLLSGALEGQVCVLIAARGTLFFKRLFSFASQLVTGTGSRVVSSPTV